MIRRSCVGARATKTQRDRSVHQLRTEPPREDRAIDYFALAAWNLLLDEVHCGTVATRCFM